MRARLALAIERAVALGTRLALLTGKRAVALRARLALLTGKRTVALRARLALAVERTVTLRTGLALDVAGTFGHLGTPWAGGSGVVTARLVAELKEGAVDAIVASLPTEDSALAERPVFRDRFFLAVPAGSPLATADRVRAADIDAADLLLLADGHCLRDQALAVCDAIDRRRLRGFGATSLTTIVQLVAAGQGITLLPELAADKAVRGDERLRLIPFAAPEPGRIIGLAWRRGSPREADFTALADAIGAACGADLADAPVATGAPSRNSSG